MEQERTLELGQKQERTISKTKRFWKFITKWETIKIVIFAIILGAAGGASAMLVITGVEQELTEMKTAIIQEVLAATSYDKVVIALDELSLDLDQLKKDLERVELSTERGLK